jgi:methylmalonyl-CoA mutase N-terminal domain/subunit
VTATADPLAGSYYVEHLTDELERGALALLKKVDALGGAEKAIAAGFFQEEIARSAYEHQLRVEKGETVVVGVNKFADDEPPPVIPTPDFSKLAKEQVERVRAVRAKRNGAAADAALGKLRESASAPSSSRPPIVPLIVEAVRARVTLGEISDTLAAAWGVHRPA